jgi:hypothetical protein
MGNDRRRRKKTRKNKREKNQYNGITIRDAVSSIISWAGSRGFL